MGPGGSTSGSGNVLSSLTFPSPKDKEGRKVRRRQDGASGPLPLAPLTALPLFFIFHLGLSVAFFIPLATDINPRVKRKIEKESGQGGENYRSEKNLTLTSNGHFSLRTLVEKCNGRWTERPRGKDFYSLL